MNRILLDTNVVLDALLERDPWVAEARAIWDAHLRYRISAHITATSLTDIFYVSRRLRDRGKAWLAVGACLDQLYILPVDLPVLQSAARIGDGDFEDHLQIAASVAAHLDAIVTRDPSGFRHSPIPVLSPAEFVALLRKDDTEGVDRAPDEAGAPREGTP
jgi:predicted nucleic acid-binding protein